MSETWLMERIPGYAALPDPDRDAIRSFAFIWSLFEAKLMGREASARRIAQAVEGWDDAGTLGAELYDGEVAYFRERYLRDGEFTSLFDGLRIRKGDMPDLIAAGISGDADIDNKPAFYRLVPGDETTFYRVRVVPNEDAFRAIAKDPAGLMGPPPPSLRRAGRMNAAGIAVFYRATEKDTAVAEMRPAVGSLISLAAFRVHRPIDVLDLTRFTRAGKQLDIFAKNQMVRATQWAFMQSFASEISQPILPGDEHLEYVPAQVVAEYLTSTSVRWRGSDVTPDAIIFRSAQREGGKNIAVMGDAALIHRPAPPDSKATPKPAAKPTTSTSWTSRRRCQPRRTPASNTSRA